MSLDTAEGEPGQRIAVVVLGMHRSGTSALTQALSLAGLTPPRQLLPARADNPEGFWESRAIVSLNDQIFSQLGTHWTSPGAIAPERLFAADLESSRHAARQILDEEFGAAPRFVIKDPRMARLMPFWVRVLADMGVGIRYALCVRHPLEVARSLERRDGFNMLHALALWIGYQLSSEQASAGHHCGVVHYEEFLQAPADTVERLLARWGMAAGPLADDTRAAITRAVKRDLRHHALTERSMTTAARVVRLAADIYAAGLSPAATIATGAPERHSEEWSDLASLDLGELLSPHRRRSANPQLVGPRVIDGESVAAPPAIDTATILTFVTNTLGVAQNLLAKVSTVEVAEYNGYVDKIEDGALSGWCWKVGTRDRVLLRLYIDDDIFGPHLASSFRVDLPNDGFHAFCIDLGGITLSDSSVIRVTTWDGTFTLIGSGRTACELGLGHTLG